MGMTSANDRSVGTAVRAIAGVYVLFVFSYVWFLPNYNLLRLGGRFTASSHASFKAGNHNHFSEQPTSGVWLEKISKTTPVNKRVMGLVLIGALALLSLTVFSRSLNELLKPGYGQGRGYGLFAHQYTYLSLRTFRI